MAPRELTPASGGELIERIHTIANALYAGLIKNSPGEDIEFEIRLHKLILMLKRFEAEDKAYRY